MTQHPTKRVVAPVVGLAFVLIWLGGGWASALAAPGTAPKPTDDIPAGPSILDPARPESGLEKRLPQPDAGKPGATAQPKADAKAADAKIPTRQERLDLLFGRLAKATDPDEASGIATAIERLWMHSGSDTADLLMTRAVVAMGTDHHETARDLLDRIVGLDPQWAEAWNKRATLRFLDDDDAGAMEDISHVLTIEPRHFGALSGMGFILRRNGLNKGALTAFRKALDVYPENQDIRKIIDELALEVEGRDL